MVASEASDSASFVTAQCLKSWKRKPINGATASLLGGVRPGTKRRTLALSARAQALMVALLSGKSVADAAKEAGISRRTADRLKSSEAFERAYSATKAELLGGAVAALHSHSLRFVSTLATVAGDTAARPGERVQASREGLSALFKGVELFDVIRRLEKLEASQQQ
ncbi:MAG: hypothetical protein ABSG03_29105 [Bryobacteraceae bacterium]|jgi:hypothetical protein